MLLILILSALAAVVTAELPMYDGRIVGGTPTTIEKHPHQVSLERTAYGHFCGGSIVAPKFVVSAAHCVLNSKVQTISVRLGTTTREQGGILVKVTAYQHNPEFNLSKLDGDVSVLTLEKAVSFSNKIKPIALIPINKDPVSNEVLTVTGWGTTENDDDLPSILQQVQVPVVDRQLCRLAYGENKISETMMCAGVSKKDSCQGDSGGPLINAKRELVGIVSWGRGCGLPGYPGVYGSVASKFIHNFITKIVNSTESKEDQNGNIL